MEQPWCDCNERPGEEGRISKTVRFLPSSICKIREGEADDEREVAKVSSSGSCKDKST